MARCPGTGWSNVIRNEPSASISAAMRPSPRPAPYRPAQTAASPGMSDGTPFLRIVADRIGAPGSPAKMPFRATNAANWSSIIRIGAKMAVIRRRTARRAVSSHTQRAGRVPYGESRIRCLLADHRATAAPAPVLFRAPAKHRREPLFRPGNLFRAHFRSGLASAAGNQPDRFNLINSHQVVTFPIARHCQCRVAQLNDLIGPASHDR